MAKLLKLQTLVFCCLVLGSNAQTKTGKNAIGISIPVIWNSSYARVGSSGKPSGNAISYGINLNYSRTIVDKIYGITSIGYLRQNFGLPRFYKLPGVTNEVGTITKPTYDNIHFRLGVGFRHILEESVSVSGSVDYNELYSFKQFYNPSAGEVTHESMTLGNSVNLNLGINKKLAPKFSIGADAVFPVIVNWKNDKNFKEDSQIARNKFSAGIEISGKFHF